MSNTPSIIMEDFSSWNHKQPAEEKQKKGAYKDLSTILICPCYKSGIHPKVVQNWMNIMAPMNTKFLKLFPTDMEVGHAYSETIKFILSHPELSKWKYVATLEHDNIVPPDWLINMYPDMGKYDALGALYYVKGVGGKPMCYGKVDGRVVNFVPFEPPPNTVTRCHGLGMGANLFKLDMFKNPKLPQPLFETRQRHTANVGSESYTQDLLFFQEAGKLGYVFGCTSKVKVGHMQIGDGNGVEDGFIW